MSTLNTTKVSDLGSSIPEMWAPGLVADAVKKSFFDNLTHAEARGFMPITERTDFSKGKGDTIHFQSVSQVYSRGVTGNTSLKGKESKLAIGTYALTVDWLRNAMAYDEQGNKEVNFSIAQTIRELLSSWCSRRIDDDLFLALIDLAGLGSNLDQLYGGSATAFAGVTAGCELGISEIERVRLALIRKGAMPIGMQTIEGVRIPIFGIAMSEIDEYRLQQDTDFDAAAKDARERAKTNPIFTNALYFIRGMILYPYYSIHSDCVQGTPLRPEAVLSSTLSNVATTITFGVTGDKKDYLQNFDDVSGANANTLQIEDEIITYNGANISADAEGCRFAITGVTRGASGTSGVEHAAGTLVTQKNVSRLIGFGAHIGARGWGMKPEPITQDEDYGFERGLGVKCIFGQTPVYRRDGKIPGYVVMSVYSLNPNSSI